MRSSSLVLLAIALGAYADLAAAQIPGDSVDLRGGRSIAGKLIHPNGASDENEAHDKFVTIETEAGGTLRLEKPKVVSRVTNAAIEFAEYKEFIETLGDSPDDHWKAYKWCAEQPGGNTKFAAQQDYHLRQVVAADPNDQQAHRRLGNIEVNGKWVNEQQFFSSRGYVRIGNDWRSQLTAGLLESGEQAKGSEAEFNKSFGRWNRNVDKMTPTQIAANRVALLGELLALKNPNAVPILAEAFDKEKQEVIQDILLEAIAVQATRYSMGKLVDVAVKHPNATMRDRALVFLRQFDKDAVANQAIMYLSSQVNPEILRAALVAGESESFAAVLPLIKALETKHKVANPNAKPQGAINSGFNNQGGGGLDLGGGGPAEVVVKVQNKEVADALRRITKRDFGLASQDWILWYTDNCTLSTVDIRADD